jgi:hypothetical protein
MQADDFPGLNIVLDGHPHTAQGGAIEVLELPDLPGM